MTEDDRLVEMIESVNAQRRMNCNSLAVALASGRKDLVQEAERLIDNNNRLLDLLQKVRDVFREVPPS